MKKFRFSVWVNSIGQSFPVVIESDTYYHANLQVKSQYPTAYSIMFIGESK